MDHSFTRASSSLLSRDDCKPSKGYTPLRSLKVCELHYDENGKIITIDGMAD